MCGGTNGSSVDLSGSTESDSGGGTGQSDDTGSGGTGSSDDNDVGCRTWDVRCIALPWPAAPAPAPAPVTAGPPTSVSASDIASIAPNNVPIHMEPDGWALLNKPVNFWVDATPQTKQGTLLGYPITVTFTPSHVDWDYGDGTTASSATTGASWIDLGQPKFTTTDTSHVYTERGTYVVTATIHYTAVVHVAGRTLDVTGYVSTSSTLAGFELFLVDPVLVQP